MSLWLELGGAYVGGLATAALAVLAGALIMRRRMARMIAGPLELPADLLELMRSGQDVLDQGDDHPAQHRP